jgi:hypothetical protein
MARSTGCSGILAHVRRKAEMALGLFTLTMPTEGGKTLASFGQITRRRIPARARQDILQRPHSRSS